MDTPTPIKSSAIARHWGVSKAYVSNLTNGPKQMPAFTSLADADTWRALNTSVKPALEAFRNSSNPPGSREKNREGSSPQQPAKKGTPTGSQYISPDGENVIDIKPFIDRIGDFDLLMVQDAEAMPKIARGLFDRACRAGNLAEIANLLKIWNEAAGKARDIRQGFLDILERKRNLVPVDEVMDIVGTELQVVRSALLKLGARIGPKANPSDPTLAQSTIDAAIDNLLRNLSTGLVRAERELVEGKVEQPATANISDSALTLHDTSSAESSDLAVQNPCSTSSATIAQEAS